jgi:hypothetical protein
MNQEDFAKFIDGILTGDVKSSVVKVAIVIIGSLSWIFFKRWLGNQDSKDAKAKSEADQIKDQAQNKQDASTIQGQLDSVKPELDKAKETHSMDSKIPKHDNSGDCKRCDLIFDTFPSFYLPLRTWFKRFQRSTPEVHISCAGRGEKAQEDAFVKKLSRAHWKESDHNYNAAVDTFVNRPGDMNPCECGCKKLKHECIYPKDWYEHVLGPEMTRNPQLDWLGRPHSPFPELPHVGTTGWKELVKSGELKLVE